MADQLSDHPAWAAARAAQADLGRELLVACNAHGLDIAWVDGPDGQRMPGLVLHMAPPNDHQDHAPFDVQDGPVEVQVGGRTASVPGSVEIMVDGRRHIVPLRVAHSPPSTFETAPDG